jgi:hypothetical protein
MTQIYIEGYELDIYEELSNQITYSIDDITRLDTKTTAFSKTITLPGTSNNNRLFGNIFEVANSNFGNSSSNPNVLYNFNASVSANARIDIDGLTIIKGVMRLLEIIVDETTIEYEVAVFGELGGFYTKLAAKKLDELDFSAYNHVYNVTNIANSWNNDNAGSGYYYPLVDYGNVSPATNVFFAKKSFYFTAFRPALFVREYIDKIITGAGYTWESNFFNSDFFKRLIIPNNQSRLQYKKTQIFSGSPTGDLGGGGVTITNTIPGFFTTSDNITWTYNGTQTFQGQVNLTIAGRWRISNQTILGNRKVAFVIYRNGVTYASELIIFGGGTTVIGGIGNSNSWVNFGFSYSFTPLFSPFTLATNDTWSLQIVSVSGTDAIQIQIQSGSISLTGVPTYAPAYYGDNIGVTDTIPKNVLQKDFFSSIVKMFYLMITEDKLKDRHLKIEPFVDYYNISPSSYLDWTDKVDRSKPYRIKPMSEITARYYELKYKQDNDYWNEKYKKKWNDTYGNIVYDNKMEFAKDKDGIEVIFASTPLVGYSGTGQDKVFPAIYKLNNGAEESTEHIIRILTARKVTGKTSWAIRSDQTQPLTGIPITLLSTTEYGYAGHYDAPSSTQYDINFGAPNEMYYDVSYSIFSSGVSNNLFNLYYSTYFAEVTDKDSRLVTYEMKLTPKDIYNLDFSRFIMIDNVLYRLDKIIDYVDGETCKVQLLRVIYNNYY